MPSIVPLEAWGGTANGWPEMALPASALWVHHSVTQPSGDALADFRVLDRIGLSQGHGGVSYSYVIHPDGTIGEGQGSRRGAHTGGQGCGGSPWGWNPCSFGVCFVGNYEEMEPSPASIESFRWLRDLLQFLGALAPGEFPTGGHRDAPGNSTACPGNNLEAQLDQLRQPYGPEEDPDVANMYISKQSDPSLGFWVTDGLWKRHIVPDEWAFIQYVSPEKAKAVPISDSWWDSLPVAGAPVGPPGPLSPEQQAAVQTSVSAGQQLDQAFKE